MDFGPDFIAAKAKLVFEILPKATNGRVRRGTLQEIFLATNGLITPNYLHQLARGKIANPPPDRLEALSRVLEFPVAWWWEPVESGPPQVGEDVTEVRAVAARLSALTPERREMALNHISELLEKIEEGA